MKGARIKLVTSETLESEARALHKSGGRMQFAYAWSPNGDDAEVRYAAALPGQQDFEMWVLQSTKPVPSLARIWPLLGWYEREITDLSGVGFTDHPEPYPLVLHDGASPSINGGNYLHRLADKEQTPPAKHRSQGRPVAAVRAYSRRCRRIRGIHVLLCRRAHHPLPPRLFFNHRGMETRFEGCSPNQAVVVAERVSGVGSVAHALAYCEAVERAADCEAPLRARALRVLLAELERLYNHLHYLGHLCHTTTLKVGEAQGKLLEERAKQVNARLTGSRFLRSILVPGGLRRDLTPGKWLGETLEALRVEFVAYVDRLEASESHLDRLITTGPLPQRVAFDQGATGPVERASGLDRDLRRDHPYAHYAELPMTVTTLAEGDAYARSRVRVAEIEAAFALCQRVLLLLEPGEIRVDCVAPPFSEGLGWTEGPRGSLFYAVHVGADGKLARVKIKSPSFSNWRAFPFTVHDTNMMDYAINEASFGLTTAGCDR